MLVDSTRVPTCYTAPSRFRAKSRVLGWERFMQASVADTTTRRFLNDIADPSIFSGGGSVAAIAAAGAASTALLVMRLNVKRRSNAAVRDQIEAAIDATEQSIEGFYTAADDDIAILADLLDAQRAQRAGGSSEEYLKALARAAESPIAMADKIVELLDTVASQIGISTRFTVSDLGAAAVLAEGACRAALLTAEVNIALLRDAGADMVATADELDRRKSDIRTRVVERAVMIEGLARARITGVETGQGDV